MATADAKLNPNSITPSGKYETDFYAWTQEQVKLLRAEKWQQIDRENLIEEIASLGKQQGQELGNRLSILVAHLLKWFYQPQCRSRSGLATIRVQRRELLKLLKDNPSLQSYLEEARLEAYANARDLAMAETDLPSSTFPDNCSYQWREIISESFYPGEPSLLIDD